MVSFISVRINLGICYFSGAQGCDFDILIVIFNTLYQHSWYTEYRERA